jgi:hypothetical protein
MKTNQSKVAIVTGAWDPVAAIILLGVSSNIRTASSNIPNSR